MSLGFLYIVLLTTSCDSYWNNSLSEGVIPKNIIKIICIIDFIFFFQVASGLVLCTILSAPLMFISAKMRMMMCYHSINYTHLIQGTSFDISILSLIACVSFSVFPFLNFYFLRTRFRIQNSLFLSLFCKHCVFDMM